MHYKDYRRPGADRRQVTTPATDEFVRRFLNHVLPPGFASRLVFRGGHRAAEPHSAICERRGAVPMLRRTHDHHRVVRLPGAAASAALRLSSSTHDRGWSDVTTPRRCCAYREIPLAPPPSATASSPVQSCPSCRVQRLPRSARFCRPHSASSLTRPCRTKRIFAKAAWHGCAQRPLGLAAGRWPSSSSSILSGIIGEAPTRLPSHLSPRMAQMAKEGGL
ncbi:hypothetical protein NKH48_24545 [Mesorhizobium sp. M1233]|uniref:hypothetical protein n=1 Tax=Mesorhizobium sp. M1233 TaxID=2957072 RepID=UPI00333C1D2C